MDCDDLLKLAYAINLDPDYFAREEHPENQEAIRARCYQVLVQFGTHVVEASDEVLQWAVTEWGIDMIAERSWTLLDLSAPRSRRHAWQLDGVGGSVGSQD